MTEAEEFLPNVIEYCNPDFRLTTESNGVRSCKTTPEQKAIEIASSTNPSTVIEFAPVHNPFFYWNSLFAKRR